jgi:hypothetical protein
VVGGHNTFGARPWGAGAVGGIVVVRVCEGARGRPRRIGVSPGRGRALVPRLHGGSGSGVGLGGRVEPQLDFGSLGGGGTGERVATRRQRGRDAAGISVPAQAGRLRGQKNAAQHDC